MKPDYAVDRRYSNHPKQRAAAHIWYQECADTLNAHGITIPVVVEVMRKYGISWSGPAFKELVWKPVMRTQKNIDSTEDQATTDVEDTRREIILLLGEALGVVLPDWPDARGPRSEPE